MQDMTRGSILRHLIRYAIPMILGNLLQLTYNAVDSILIGKFLGENALAAVSTSDPIFTILVLGASGISLGASVMISKFRGAKEEEKIRQEFSTALIFGCFFSLAVFLIGFLLSGTMLRWIQTPEAAMKQAKTYLRLCLIGFLFTFQYNVLASSLRGLGDSKTPVYFLGVSCGLNILLDVLLVAVIPLGVAGAAIATVISQAVAALGSMAYICRRIPQLSIQKEHFRIHSALLKETLSIGFLTALQQAAQPIGKVCIQGVINTQGIAAIDAFNAGCKLEDFARIPTQSIGNGIMTCTAQNRGAGQEDRMFQSLTKGLLLSGNHQCHPGPFPGPGHDEGGALQHGAANLHPHPLRFPLGSQNGHQRRGLGLLHRLAVHDDCGIRPVFLLEKHRKNPKMTFPFFHPSDIIEKTT